MDTFYPPEPNILGWLQAFSLESDTVLDVGSGDGRSHNIPVKSIETVDCWPAANPDYLLDLEKDDLPAKSYDVVLMIDLLEHLEKKRGVEILRQAQNIATRAVVVLTPLKWDANQDAFNELGGFYEGNEHILHRSLWTLADFPTGWTRVLLPSTQDNFFGYWVK